MKKIFSLYLTAALFGTLAISCSPTQRGAGTGAVAGAAVGAIIADGDDHKKGALIGAGVGAVTGAAVSRNQQRKHTPPSPYYH